MRLVVLASGRGSNLQTIIDNIHCGKLKAEVTAVISDKEDAYALKRARNASIPDIYINPSSYSTREDYNNALADKIEEYQPDYILLAGYMRILAPALVERFPLRIINIHPSLLPAFPGLHAQRQAWEYGVKVSGCTVHFVDSGLDTGPIIAQRAVSAFDNDTEETLASRILEQEHLLYTEVICLLSEGRVCVEGRKVRIK